MATNNMLQYLESTGEDEFGSSVSLGVTPSYRRQVETFIAAEAIVAKDAVAFDFNQTADGDKVLHVKKAGTAEATTHCFVGIALEGAASGERLDVCIAGICEANVDGTTAQGDSLIISSTDGRLVRPADYLSDSDGTGSDVANKIRPVCAIACEADDTNVATVVVLKQF